MAQPGILNLNDEVVKMRKEVKRIRVLVIRKLVRSVSRLKSKKGTEDALLKNQRRAQRLLEEIHAIKPDSTATERAVARLAVHPLLKKKVDALKATVKTFKETRQNADKVQSSKASEENHSMNVSCSNDEASKLQHEGTVIDEQKEKEAKMLTKKPINNKKEKMGKMEHGPKVGNIPTSPSKPSGKDSLVPFEPWKTCSDPEMKTSSQTKNQKESDSLLGGSSDGEESHEEEKEYFDDSTEERFYRQSSMSEDSDSGDDFFIGKARRTRKKEKSSHSSVMEQTLPQEVFPKEEILETSRNIRNDENKPSAETGKFESVFFRSLSGSKSSRREQAPKSKTSGFQRSEPQIKNQFAKSAQRGLRSTKQQLQLPLHPSWEASRKRKEQQSKIAVFQGKKITFDD
ncbi:serum response factor-binding protein 1 isoform X2 [Tamandua tetradactyla]|uniref:serum response factor-binding protein 1 isoform X2 n=1 Tax=Tamandua tetradactyla TaxID=48850 RepID=UPI004053C189